MIPVDHMKEGMIVADDVRDINTRLLISAGEKIKPKHIRILKIWGVPEVKIVGAESKEIMNDDSEDNIEEKEKKIQEVFRHVNRKHPALKEICRLALKYRSTAWQIKEKQKTSFDNQKISDLKKTAYLRIEKTQIKLPEAPVIITELNSIIANQYSGADDIAKVVNKSPSLSALLLKIVNSAFYNFPEKINSIPWAVTLIGTKEIVNLAMGISVMETFKDIPKTTVDMPSFLTHSFSCGILSRILGAHQNLSQTEQLFISGLLHDIGRLVMFKYFPDQSNTFLQLSMGMKEPLYRIENEYSGLLHTTLAGYLLQKWKLPIGLLNNVTAHHTPSKAQDTMKATIIHISDIIVTALGLGTSGESFIHSFDGAAWNRLHMTPKIFESVIQQMLHQLKFLSLFEQD